jgi:hypothetical protein
MTTDKQIQANRLNGLKGGVKTAEGKAISRMNAVKHGLLTQDVLLPGEDSEQLMALRRLVFASLQPGDPMENILVERIISILWRLKRTQRSEKKYSRPPAQDQTDLTVFIAGGDYRFTSWQNYSRYETTLENRFYKALRELEHRQNTRLSKPAPQPLSLTLEQ